MVTFASLCLSGDALLEDIDNFVDAWHDNSLGMNIYDYLGMTRQEYALWVERPDALSFILNAREKDTLSKTILFLKPNKLKKTNKKKQA